MKKDILLFMTILLYGNVSGQRSYDKDLTAIKYASTITQSNLSEHLHIIAADSMEGRLTGTPGQKKAAKYIASHFKSLELKAPVQGKEGKSYFQEFKQVKQSWDEVYVQQGNKKFEFMRDLYVLHQSNLNEEIEIETIFIGKGKEEDVNLLDITGKGVILFSDKKDEEKATWLRKKGARAVLMIKGKNQKDFIEALEYNAYYLKRPQSTLSNRNPKETVIFYLSPIAATKILNTNQATLFANKNNLEKFAGSKIKLKASVKETISFQSENVLGYLEGTDKKDEVVIITAHYDHIGTRGQKVNNGADDDGSGTVAVMEIAEAFVKAHQEGNTPRRSILFMTVAGEELGLYGSRFYTDFEPIFPLKNTVTNLNIDMIGRIGGDYQKAKNPDYVYLIGSDKLSTDLHNLSEEVNKKYTHIKLDYKYNDENDPNRFYYRSDHYNFAKNKIPIIFYFNGTHPDYHQPTDTVDKIHFPKLEKITRLVFHTAWEIANQEERLKVDKK